MVPSPSYCNYRHITFSMTHHLVNRQMATLKYSSLYTVCTCFDSVPLIPRKLTANFSTVSLTNHKAEFEDSLTASVEKIRNLKLFTILVRRYMRMCGKVTFNHSGSYVVGISRVSQCYLPNKLYEYVFDYFYQELGSLLSESKCYCILACFYVTTRTRFCIRTTLVGLKRSKIF